MVDKDSNVVGLLNIQKERTRSKKASYRRRRERGRKRKCMTRLDEKHDDTIRRSLEEGQTCSLNRIKTTNNNLQESPVPLDSPLSFMNPDYHQSPTSSPSHFPPQSQSTSRYESQCSFIIGTEFMLLKISTRIE
jgi:hypothetical protein